MSASIARSRAEIFDFARFSDLAAVQRAFDAWRELYNFERPHAALDLDVPAVAIVPVRAPCPSTFQR